METGHKEINQDSMWRGVMNYNPELIVMLTYHDRTVENACQIFEQCKNAKAKF